MADGGSADWLIAGLIVGIFVGIPFGFLLAQALLKPATGFSGLRPGFGRPYHWDSLCWCKSLSEDVLLKLAVGIVAAEETAREISKRLAGRVAVQVERAKPVSRVKTIEGFKVPGTLIDEEGAGTLKELLIKSDSPNYTLYLFIDGNPVYNHSWSWFNENSQEIEEISAFRTEDGIYVLHLYDLKFSRSLLVKVNGASQSLNLVFYKLELTNV